MSLMFLAWVKEPPDEEMVTANPSGFTQKDFFSPERMESVLYLLVRLLQFLVDISFNSNSQNSWEKSSKDISHSQIIIFIKK